MRTSRPKKLTLSRESLVRLAPGHLETVAGGDIPPATQSCQTCRNLCPLQTFDIFCYSRRQACFEG